jgi:hypothetical protein
MILTQMMRLARCSMGPRGKMNVSINLPEDERVCVR